MALLDLANAAIESSELARANELLDTYLLARYENDMLPSDPYYTYYYVELAERVIALQSI